MAREEERMVERLRGHVNNDVWERRTEPPSDWNKPLPKELAEKAEKSLFKIYQDNNGTLPIDESMHNVGSNIASTSMNVVQSCTIL